MRFRQRHFAAAGESTDEAKSGESIGAPLNDEAMAALREELGKHPLRVFTFKGRPVGQANTRAWRNALKRHHDGGTARARCVEIRRDGEALRALRAGAIAGGGRQTGYIFVCTAEKRNAGINASY